MLCIRHRLWQSGPIFIVCSLILTTGFLLQFHMLYTIHQKNIRLTEYNAQVSCFFLCILIKNVVALWYYLVFKHDQYYFKMNELYDTMKTVERVAKRTAIMFHKLKKVVANHKAPRSKISHTVS